jgi:CDGSH-type Zn-finger protein/uncharacterized Fe-S cluster protein YjdI
MAEIEEVRGKRVVIRFESNKCIHSRNCVLGHPEIFEPNVTGEWIHPDATSPETVARVAHACPSGAITYECLDSKDAETAPVVNLMYIRENGPLAFNAPLVLDGDNVGFRATLCRCGASKNKPYCDGSHVEAGFAATGEPTTQDSEQLAVRNGDLAITSVSDGPLQIKGSLEFVSGTGRTLNRVEEAYLCRCGASENKPYCDGSHKKVGFKS